MKEKLKNPRFLEILLKTFNILFIIGFCWIFSDCMQLLISNPVKSILYSVIGGCYIGAYGAMTSQMWTDQLYKNMKE